MTEGREFGLIGDPVAHSLSPVMHRAAFSVLGIKASYELYQVPAERPDLVEAAMRRIALNGGGNVTVPHKEVAARVLDRPTQTVTTLGACNCFWQDESGALAGDNTDVGGIRTTLELGLGACRPAQVLLLGAGGAAAAAGLAVAELGATEVVIFNRTADRARALVEKLELAGVHATVAEAPPSGEYDVIINATSLGLHEGDPLPLSFDNLSPSLVLDLVYRKGKTAWTHEAELRSIDWIDGREVLLQQGASCYPLWFGLEAPIDVMRRALFGGDN